MRAGAKGRAGGRRWHMNDLLAMELFVCVLAILTAVTLGVSHYRDGIHRAQTLAAWQHLRPMQLLWIEENAVAGTVASDAIAYQRTRVGAESAAPDEGSALGSVRGLEALRSRAARQDAAESKGEEKSERVRTGLSDGVPVATINRDFTGGPALIELRPATSGEEAPVVTWLCGRVPPPRGWLSPPAREPQIADLYLPHVCRPRRAA